MKVENTTVSNEQNFTFKEFKGTNSSIALTLTGDSSNCKLSYIHSAGYLNLISDENKKEVMNFLLDKAKGCVILNTTNEKVFNFLKNNYPTYYANKVPIGYGTNYQYHVCIKNTIRVNQNCRLPEGLNGNIDKNTIKDKLNTILKSKRRKTDFVDEFIRSL